MAQQSLLKPLNVSKATVAIIGTAGRRKENEKMSKELFCQMVTKAEEVIAKDFKLELSQVRLVSGGAAWAGMLFTVDLLRMLKYVGLT